MEIEAKKIDAHVGARMRARRETLGITQGDVARELGLTFSQVQKYEKGANRIGAGRLFLLSRLLDVPVQHFYEGLAEAPGGRNAAPASLPVAENREIAELGAAFRAIPDAGVRASVLEMIRAIRVPSAAIHRPRHVNSRA